MSDHAALLKAAEDGDAGAVEAILDGTEPDDLHVGSLDMAIERAVRSGHVEVAELLLDSREEIPTHLHPNLVLSAARHGPAPIAKRIFDLSGGIAHVRLGRRTPLHSAAQGDQAEIIGILLQQGINVDLHREQDRETPLHVAARWGSRSAARRLLFGGADPNATDQEGMTPLTLADMEGHWEICQALLIRGANPATRAKHMRTALHRAAATGSVTDIRAALANGGDPNARDHWGDTPLHLAAGRIRPSIVRTLLDAGADLDAQNRLGNTPLLSATTPTTIRLLLEHPSNLDLTGAYGWSALHALASMGDGELLSRAIDAGASLELRNDRGETPFLTAAAYLRAECLQVLADAGADVSVRDDTGRRAAELAVEGTDQSVPDREIVATIRTLAALRPPL